MSCDLCNTSPKGQDESFSQIKTQAKLYAKETAQPIAIYRDGNEYGYIDAVTAFAGNYQIREVVSQYS